MYELLFYLLDFFLQFFFFFVCLEVGCVFVVRGLLILIVVGNKIIRRVESRRFEHHLIPMRQLVTPTLNHLLEVGINLKLKTKQKTYFNLSVFQIIFL